MAQQRNPIPHGSWSRVRARIRPLRPAEAPAASPTLDGRMVEFFRQHGPFLEPDWPEDWSYNPLREPKLLTEFLHVFGRDQAPTDDEVIWFYGQYGRLGELTIVGNQYVPLWVDRLEAQDQQRLLADKGGLDWCEPVWWLRERGREMQLLYQLYLGLQENRLNSIRSLLGPVPEGKRICGIAIVAGTVIRDVAAEHTRIRGVPDRSTLERLEAAPPESEQKLQPLSDEECVRWARRLLASRLTAGEGRTFTEWVDVRQALEYATKGEPDGNPRSGTAGLVRVRSVQSLLAALYAHLGQLVSAGVVLRQCPGCDRLFYPGRSDQQYCDRRCGDAARQRVYYRDRKENGAARSAKRKTSRGKARG